MCIRDRDYLAAKLYYDLGSYTGNSTYSTTGNNYLSCIVTAQNALKDLSLIHISIMRWLMLRRVHGLPDRFCEL